MRLKLPEPGYLIYCAANASSSVLWLIGGIGLATLGLVVLSGLWAGAESDAAALERQRSLINQRLHEQVDQVAEAIDQVSSGYMALLSSQVSRVPSPVSSGDALASEVAGPESAETISKIVVAVFGYDQAFVVDGNGQLAMRSGPEVEARYRWIRPLLLPLLRERQPGANPARRMSNNNVLANSSESSSRRGSFAELMRLEGRPTIAGIAPINRAEDLSSRELPLTSQDMRYLIAIRFLDGAALDDLSREQGLNGARFARSADPDPNEVAVQIDAGATGEPIGFIVWSPDLPGSRVIGRLLPALLGAALVIAVLFLLLLKRLRTSLIELKLSEANARHLASHDVLTALPNRAYFSAQLEDCLAQKPVSDQRSAIALIDLDRFKFVNDSMGHKAGDVLLMTVAARLRSSLRDSDTVARLSGDEFVVILSEHSEEPLSAAIVQRVMDAVAQPVLLGNKEFFVTCSIGVAVYPSEGTGSDNLIEHADIAMYRAKKMGRNNFQFYTPAMNEESLERVRIEGALRNALDRDEFVLHYQPQVDLKSGQIVGMEALIRWNHPELGMVPPNRFVSVAEETGLIVPIGAWVMRTACAQNKAWQDAGYQRLRVAVNLSARQFGASDLLASLESALSETGLDPACLEIELTESLFMSDVTPAVELLHRMKALGVNLSIDDFGTGYSSFSYLSRFPIDVLKIDRSFVSDITVDANDAAIVTSIIALAHNLKLAVIAEGVETAEQLDYLRSHGCDEMQGYYFSRPLPAHEFEQLLRERRALALPALTVESVQAAAEAA